MKNIFTLLIVSLFIFSFAITSFGGCKKNSTSDTSISQNTDETDNSGEEIGPSEEEDSGNGNNSDNEGESEDEQEETTE